MRKTMKINSLLLNKTTYLTAFFLMLLFAAAPDVFASEPKLVSGSTKLGEDILKWILLLVPTTGAAAIGYHAWMKSMADGDPGAVAQRNKSMKNILIGIAIAETAAGLITAFIAYYK